MTTREYIEAEHTLEQVEAYLENALFDVRDVRERGDVESDAARKILLRAANQSSIVLRSLLWRLA